MDDQDDSSNFSVEDVDNCRPCYVLLKRLDDETIQKYCQIKDNNIDEQDDSDDSDGYQNGDIDEGDSGVYKRRIDTVDLSHLPDPQAYLNQMKKRRAAGNSDDKSTKSIFSIFTLEDFYDRNEAILSYYDQLKYAPYKCVECDEATLNMDLLIEHHLSEHQEQTTVKYRSLEVSAKEKWVRAFVNYQLAVNEGKEKPLPNNILHKYCPVCNHYDWKSEQQKLKRSNRKFSPVLDKNHINKHLRYFPFLCMLCRQDEKRYSLTIPNAKARDHLLEIHNFPQVTANHIEQHFKPIHLIPELENFLRDYVGIIQDNSATQDSNTTNNQKSKSQSSSKDNKKQKKSPTSVSSKQSSGKTPKLSSKPKPRTSAKGRGKNGEKLQLQYESYRRMREIHLDSDEDSDESRGEWPTESRTINSNAVSSNVVCIFCGQQDFSDKYEVWDHYSTHLDYNPIVCNICNQRFHGVSSFRYHGVEHVDAQDLPFSRVLDETLENWGAAFIEQLDKGDQKDPSFAAYCPICKLLFPPPSYKPSIPEQSVRKHVLHHLKYFPYECQQCIETQTYLPDLTDDRLEHLQRVHNINCDSSSLDVYFSKSRSISALDNFIEQHFSQLNC